MHTSCHTSTRQPSHPPAATERAAPLARWAGQARAVRRLACGLRLYLVLLSALLPAAVLAGQVDLPVAAPSAPGVGATSVGTPIPGAPLPDAAACRAECNSDKKWCLAQVGRVDVPAAAGMAATLGMIFGQAAQHPVQQHDGHDTAAAIAQRQRRDAEAKMVQREQATQCNTQYLQCLGACRPAVPVVPTLPTPPRAADVP